MMMFDFKLNNIKRFKFQCSKFQKHLQWRSQFVLSWVLYVYISSLSNRYVDFLCQMVFVWFVQVLSVLIPATLSIAVWSNAPLRTPTWATTLSLGFVDDSSFSWSFLSLRLEGDEALKQRCVYRPPCGKF